MVALIGIIGRTKSGKATVARLLANQFDHSSIRYLTEDLRWTLSKLYRFTPEQQSSAKDTVDLRYNRSPREIQMVWERYLSENGRDFIIRNTLAEFDRAVKKGSKEVWIVPDVSCNYDSVAIRERGGRVIKVVRPTATAVLPSSPGDSQSDKIPHDDVIINDGNLVELNNRIMAYIKTRVHI